MTAQPATAANASQKRPGVSSLDLALLGVVVAWGVGYVAFRIGQREIPTGIFNLLRYIIATPVFWLFLLRSGEDWRLPRADWPRATFTGLIGVLVYSMFFAGAAKITNAANVALLLAMSPVWGVLMGWAGGRGAPSLRFAIGSAVAFGGAALVIAFGGGGLEFSLASLQGDLMALIGSVIWAWYGIVAQPLLKNHSGTKVQAWINLIALVGFAIYQGPAALQFDWSVVTLGGWISLLYVALMVTVFGHIIWYTAIAKVGPDRVMLAMYLVPAFAAVCGALFLQQPFGLLQIVGAVVALGGVFLVRRSAA